MVVSMTQHEIIGMAKKCGWDNPANNMMPLYEFAKLVAEHEREACAKLEIELILSPAFFATMGEYDAHKDAVLAYRNLIQARGQA
jgi:hypothetical protein